MIKKNNAVNDVSFSLKKGRTLCIVGESGCGKSATALSLMRLLPNSASIEGGKIIYYKNDNEIIRIDELKKNGEKIRSLRGSDIAMVFQDPMTALNPVYSVGFQIIENILCHNNISKNKARNDAISLLRKMGVSVPEKRIDEYPHQYSGGMRQRAMIALAMGCNPKVLIADEATTALDVTIQSQIFELMNKLKQEYDTALLLITHDMGIVAELADDVVVMYMGEVVERGAVSDIFKSTAHPYTRALLKSIPILGCGKNQTLEPIKGITPDPFNRPKGCQFSTRCDLYTDECLESPNEKKLSSTHSVRCWKYEVVLNER